MQYQPLPRGDYPRKLDLDKLNSATKYPSIPTYHALGARGILCESGNPFAGYQGPIVATEKVDGTNARIIMTHDEGWFIGSRDRLMTAREDRVYDPDHGIVDTLRDVAEKWLWGPKPDEAHVYYFEVYGGKTVPGYKIYGDGTELGYRLFDVATIPVRRLFAKSIEEVAQWRDNGGQEFWPWDSLTGMPYLNPVPELGHFGSGDELPADIEDMADLLATLASKTQVGINDGADPKRGPEGIVFRTRVDRHKIFKARWESYNKTMLLGGGAQPLLGPGSGKDGGK